MLLFSKNNNNNNTLLSLLSIKTVYIKNNAHWIIVDTDMYSSTGLPLSASGVLWEPSYSLCIYPLERVKCAGRVAGTSGSTPVMGDTLTWPCVDSVSRRSCELFPSFFFVPLLREIVTWNPDDGDFFPYDSLTAVLECIVIFAISTKIHWKVRLIIRFYQNLPSVYTFHLSRHVHRML